MGLIDTTRQMISTYEESEAWKREHARAMQCLDIEQLMAWGIHLFRGLLDFEARLQSAALRGDLSADDPVWVEFEPLYQRWAKASDRLLARADELVGEGCNVAGIEDFRDTVMEAQCLIDNNAQEYLIPPIEELIPLLKPQNPRPELYGD